MKIIFKNPTTEKFEVGVIFKRVYGSKGKRYHVINEKGSVFLYLPAVDDNIGKVKGYIDFELTATCMPHITTNLNLENQGNYLDKNFIPAIKKFS
jgi:hypothetical protein